MNRSTDQSLQSLLPTHNGAFPPQLADLASSLLAQSRHRVSTLKADEEVARPYACAHIACDRLKTVLNLPPIEPRPPIQPRLYKRLYAHLNTVLQPTPADRGSREVRTPRKDGLQQQRDTPGRTPFGTAATPERRTARTPRPTPKSISRSKSTYDRRKADGTTTSARTPKPAPTPKLASLSTPPPWLRPTVRFVCSSLGHARLAPTVAAGLSAVLREAALGKVGRGVDINGGGAGDEEERGSPAWVAANLTALAAALYYYCIQSWQASQGGSGRGRGRNRIDDSPGQDAATMDKKRYNLDERALLDVFQKAREGGVHLDKDADDGSSSSSSSWEAAGWRDLTRHSFRDALLVVSDRKWLESDWFRDIQQLRDVAGSDCGDDDEDKENNGGNGGYGEDDEDGSNDDSTIPTHAWRSDSMFQERYDLLSETRRLDYARWKKEVLQLLADRKEAATSSSGGGDSDAMDVDRDD